MHAHTHTHSHWSFHQTQLLKSGIQPLLMENILQTAVVLLHLLEWGTMRNLCVFTSVSHLASTLSCQMLFGLPNNQPAFIFMFIWGNIVFKVWYLSPWYALAFVFCYRNSVYIMAHCWKITNKEIGQILVHSAVTSHGWVSREADPEHDPSLQTLLHVHLFTYSVCLHLLSSVTHHLFHFLHLFLGLRPWEKPWEINRAVLLPTHSLCALLNNVCIIIHSSNRNTLSLCIGWWTALCPSSSHTLFMSSHLFNKYTLLMRPCRL